MRDGVQWQAVRLDVTKSHKQALIALARRRTNTIWAMLRDRTTYQEPARPEIAPAA